MLWSVLSFSTRALVTKPNNLHRILDALNLALTIHAMYYYLVLHFQNVEALIHVVWYVQLTPIADSR